MLGTFELIPLESIRVQKHNVRLHEINRGVEDLAASIKANGLLQPIRAYYDSKQSHYVILTGQRRLNAYQLLNKNHPGGGFDKILCNVIPEPKTWYEMQSMSLTENITQLPMTNSDLIKAVTDLYNVYGDYEMVQEKFGLTKRMVNKYVRLARLPPRLKQAIQEQEISHDPRKAEKAALDAVNALQYIKNGRIPVEQVLELAKAMANPENNPSDLAREAKRGGTVQEMEKRAAKREKVKIVIHLDGDVADKLQKVSADKGDSGKLRATQYVIDGVEKDYRQLGD